MAGRGNGTKMISIDLEKISFGKSPSVVNVERSTRPLKKERAYEAKQF